ncbi:MAG: DUF1476 domain-containing protein [Phycisphaeraceae bacterium]|nr:DUF1476 domain-containing protein [Phycisphaeraceae bacterium]
MSGIDDRRKGMEAKLHHDGELKFKVNNRRNKLLGLWLAGQFGVAGDEAEAYAKTVVLSDFEEPGDEDVVRKVMADIEAKNASIDEVTVRKQMEALIETAKDQIFSEAE